MNYPSKDEILSQIDAEIEKWTSRKVWIKKCELESENSELRAKVVEMERQIEVFRKPAAKGYDPTVTLWDLERDWTLRALRAHEGDKYKAAMALGIGVKVLMFKLDEYGYYNPKVDE